MERHSTQHECLSCVDLVVLSCTRIFGPELDRILASHQQ